ncbi:MAG: methyltransferase domain-containing protein [Ginsengibacter sp.]
MKFTQYITTLISYATRPEKRKLIKISYGLKDKTGLEIGGPSAFFNLKSYFPVYVFAKRIDGVNYSAETVWEGKIEEGTSYAYANNKKGFQYILEASELDHIENEKYDFLLSCHSLEHVANPIKALQRWNEVLKKDGKIVLVLPNKDFTFDHKRPYTTFAHLLQDFNEETNEHDTTHFEETLGLHDISKDAMINSPEELKARMEDNFSNRCVHHHVYSLELISELLIHCGFKIKYQQKAKPFHLITVAEKIAN